MVLPINQINACSLYFSFLVKGIQLSFFDASYLDTELLRLNSEPSADQKPMIRRIIQNYFDNAGGRPSGPEGVSSADASSVKKNLILEQTRSEAIRIVRNYAHEVSLMEAFLREKVISVRTYKRYFRKHSVNDQFPNTSIAAVQKSAHYETGEGSF